MPAATVPPSAIGNLRCDLMKLALGYTRSTFGVSILMLKRHGDKAVRESAERAEELAVVGDAVGVAIWFRVIDAIEQLANTSPSGPVH